MIKDLEGLIKKLNGMYPVFAMNIRKDEVEKNPSFFIYNDDGEITKATSGINQYKTNFHLSFFTRGQSTLNQIEVIEMCKKHALIFDRTEIDVGKIQDLDVEAKMVTFVLHHIDKVM
ncbi:hypothetical protein [Metaclostridioides mangenotii]|uniref:hypothetical protein n=1 Tax=Metaclostridioides mangenotii TaxID=1540 RepID=UPI000462EAF1|nr:hypothetical protein [Clostridioides mangenotii]